MVKAEFERDYYADLELQPSATANDVKKQFKKLALQYHPDRNPSGDSTAKFQAIQSANEVLTDPQQRAKYDAQRIRSELLHTYTDAPPPPPRNNGSRPSAFSNFPPPPRPPPMTTKKSTFSPPPPSGAQKYARFSTPETPSWRTRDTDDAKSKTNDFKAWEHMRHGQGPIPRGRRETKPPSPQPTRERQEYTGHNANNTVPKRTTPRRTDWENLQDAGIPNISRSNSTRMPSKPFTSAPGTPGVGSDGSQARSAYFNISRDRPAPSRVQTSMPPPPARAPTAKKPDPLQAFKSSARANNPFGTAQRAHTQYPTVHGEKTNISPGPGLRKASTTAIPRDSNSRTEFYDSDSLRPFGHARSASASSPFRNPRASAMASVSTSSSDSSSDEEEAAQKEATDLSKSAFNRPKQQPKTRQPNTGAGAPQRSFFNPYVTVDEAKDEPMAPDAAYSGPRRHSGVEFPTHKRADDPSEGFMEQRKKHEAARLHETAATSPSDSGPSHFMQRPKSFDVQYRRPVQEEDVRPSTANQEATPMYEPGYNPFSFPSLGPLLDIPSGLPFIGTSSSGRWSERWPFGPLKKPKYSQADIPPYWAIPSTLPASENPHVRKNAKDETPFPVCLAAAIATHANDKSLSSFHWTAGDLPMPFAGTPPLRSQSTENIDVKFSPAVHPPKFGYGGGFSSSAPSNENSDNPIEIIDNKAASARANDDEAESSVEKTPSGAPPKGPACFFSNDWHQRAWAGTFQADPVRSQNRSSSQRRVGTPKAPSLNNTMKSGPQRNTGLQPSMNDVGDEPPTYTNATGENLSSSRVSSEGSAMDIDPVLTPPPGNDNQPQSNGSDISPTRPNEPTRAPNQAPSLPPRAAPPVQSDADSLNIDLGVFHHIKPFGPSGDGLQAVDDLSQALPFESRASSSRPQAGNAAQGLKMPKPPKAPSPPKPLNPTTWKFYLNAMASYMSNWSNFNNTMLSHFHIRQEAQKQMNPGWMSAQGDGDYNAYLDRLTEDEKVRKWWEVACDKHKDYINTLGEVRLAMKAEAARAKNFPYPT